MTMNKCDLRPCVVKVYKYDKSRGVPFLTDVKKRAWFHCWNHKSIIVPPSIMKGGHNGGMSSDTLAIVEFDDGTISEVSATDVVFEEHPEDDRPFQEVMMSVLGDMTNAQAEYAIGYLKEKLEKNGYKTAGNACEAMCMED
jgi:hypothetical protein